MTDLILVLQILFGLDRILRYFDDRSRTGLVNLIAGIVILLTGMLAWSFTHLVLR